MSVPVLAPTTALAPVPARVPAARPAPVRLSLSRPQIDDLVGDFGIAAYSLASRRSGGAE